MATELQIAEGLYRHNLIAAEAELGLLRQHLGAAIGHFRAAANPSEDMDAQDVAAETRRGQRQMDQYEKHRKGVRALLRDVADPTDPDFVPWPANGDWRNWTPPTEERVP